MKKLLLSTLFIACTGCTGTAYASDGGMIYDGGYATNTRTVQYAGNNNGYAAYNAGYAQPTNGRPCDTVGQAVSVKTGVQVINTYQVYQPVTTWQAAGTYSDSQSYAVPTANCGGNCGGYTYAY